MTLSALESFVTVCDCRSFSRAAEKLYVTQPALSRRIKQLEEELGVELTETTKSGIRPTPAGVLLYAKASEMLNIHDSITEKMHRYKKGMAGNLHLGVSLGVPLTMIIPAIAKMSSIYPDVQLIIESNASLNLVHLLMDGNIDVAIDFASNIYALDAFHCRKLADNRLSVLVPKAHSFFDRQSLCLSDFENENLLIPGAADGIGFRKAMLFFEKSGMRYHSLTKCSTLGECMMYVATGKYLGLVGTSWNEQVHSVPDYIRAIPVILEDYGINGLYAAYTDGNPFAKVFVETMF